MQIWQSVMSYSGIIAALLSLVFAFAVGLLFTSGQTLITPKQHRRIRKLKLTYDSGLKPLPKKSKSFSIKVRLKDLVAAAGFADLQIQVIEIIKIFSIISFLLSLLLSYMLGFSFNTSIEFAVISFLLSPSIPIAGLFYLKSRRNALVVDELYMIMSHIYDAVESAGRTLPAALEDSLYVAPILAPYLVVFLNTYLTIGLAEAVKNLKDTINLEEMDLFLDVLAHGFEHSPKELTRYFQSESDAYHELEVAAKQRRMDRREVLFDIIIVFPFILGFGLMIYPVFMEGVRAITHAI